MTKIDERTAANMAIVLEEACQDLPQGGDHESRKYVAKKLMQSVKKGNVTLEGAASGGQPRAFRIVEPQIRLTTVITDSVPELSERIYCR